MRANYNSVSTVADYIDKNATIGIMQNFEMLGELCLHCHRASILFTSLPDVCNLAWEHVHMLWM